MSALIRTYTAQMSAAIRASMVDRGSFLLQSGAMVLNNAFVLAMWYLFFAGFKSVGGWRMADMALLNALLALVIGTAYVVAGGYRDLARQIVTGVPDALLTQPKAILPRLLASESNVTGWGDILTGIVLLLTVADVHVRQVGWIAFVLLCGFIVFVATACIFGSIAFWATGARSFARDLTDFLISFSFYPGSIYGGTLKLIVWTIFPAAFITLIPVALIRNPDWEAATVLSLATLVYVVLTAVIFALGLTRYRRGEVPISGL